MINPQLHRQAVALDQEQHRQLRVDFPVADWSVAERLNAIFVAAAEFADAGREYPIVFVRAGRSPEGRDLVAPVAVFGVLAEQNLYVEGPEGARTWRASYKPAVLQAYPFCVGHVGDERFAVCADMAWSGIGNDRALPLFEADGQPAQLLKAMQQHLELLEGEILNTRRFGERLLELDLLRDMRFDATLPDGSKHTVDGFLIVDQEKAQKLSDKVIGEMHRNGMLGLMHLHWASLGLMRRLVDWHLQRQPAAAGAEAPATAGTEGGQAPAGAPQTGQPS